MMFKKLSILTILVVLLLVGSMPAVSAQSWPPSTFHRVHNLAKGSIRVANDIHIMFSARQVNEDGAGRGHVFWREDGQTILISVDTVNYGAGQGWTCAYMSGVVFAGHETRERLCFMVCDDYETAAQWDGVFYFYEEFSGRVYIKP